MVNEGGALHRVTRSVTDEETIEVHPGKVVIPGDDREVHITVEQHPDDILLRTTVHEDHSLGTTLGQMDHLRCGDLSHKIDFIGLEEVYILIIHHQLTDERTMVTDHLGELPRVDTCETDHAMALESIREGLCGIPVRVVISVVVDDESQRV